MSDDQKPRHTLTDKSYEENMKIYIETLSLTKRQLEAEIQRMNNNLSPNPTLVESILPGLLKAGRRVREQNLLRRAYQDARSHIE